MQAVLITLLSGIGAVKLIIEISLILSFIILAAFTWTSGLRGAALGSIMKNVLILITVVVVVLVVVTIGGFHTALLTEPKTLDFNGAAEI